MLKWRVEVKLQFAGFNRYITYKRGRTLTLLLMEKLSLERKSRNFEGKAKLYLAFN